jgi:hypothetical protein
MPASLCWQRRGATGRRGLGQKSGLFASAAAAVTGTGLFMAGAKWLMAPFFGFVVSRLDPENLQTLQEEKLLSFTSKETFFTQICRRPYASERFSQSSLRKIASFHKSIAWVCFEKICYTTKGIQAYIYTTETKVFSFCKNREQSPKILDNISGKTSYFYLQQHPQLFPRQHNKNPRQKPFDIQQRGERMFT